MNFTPSESALEKISGNLITEAALTVVGAIAGGPLAPLLPVLAKSLAANRQQARVESALADVQHMLVTLSDKVEVLSDEQYKIVNEAILAMLQTTQTEKLTYLRNVVRNALDPQDCSSHDAILLSRIIRDISSEEVEFLLKSFADEGILLSEPQQVPRAADNRILVSPESKDALIVSGLLSLGLLAPPETGWDGGTMIFTRIVAKLIALLKQPNHSSQLR